MSKSSGMWWPNRLLTCTEQLVLHRIHLMQLVADTWSVDACARSTQNSFLIGTWGFHMKAGTNVVHLITKIPHKRMRAIPRCKDDIKDSDSDNSDAGSEDLEDEDSEPEETATELRFLLMAC